MAHQTRQESEEGCTVGEGGGRRRAWSRRAGCWAAAAGLALAAACGGSKAAQSGPPGGRSSGVGSVYAQAVAYAGCMRNQGVPSWPDPDSAGVFAKSAITPQKLGLSAAQIDAAQTACQHLYPNYASAGPTPAEVAQVRAQALRFSQCMRDHGITDFPDPDSRGGIRIPHSMENSPQYLTALNACKPFPPPPYPAN